MALVSIVIQQCNKAVTGLHSNKTVDYRLLFESDARHGEGQSIVAARAVLHERSRKIDAHVCSESF
jgi:hypothetical protein